MKTITRKSLLYKSGVDYGDYSLNHVLGCSHGCLYPCYEMQRKIRHKQVNDYADWTEPKLVINALEILNKEIPKLKNKIKAVHLCFSTDPFMYKQKEVKKMTLEIIAKLNKAGIKCVVLTKGTLPKELASEKYSRGNEYGITLVSHDKKFQKKYEPNASPPDRRLSSLRYLHEQGLKTWVSMEPYPTYNIVHQFLGEVLEKIKFVDKIVFGSWNYNKPLVSGQKNSKQLYIGKTYALSKFCKENNIEYHVKMKGKEYDKFRNPKLFQN